jgi:hypothetical protein
LTRPPDRYIFRETTEELPRFTSAETTLMPEAIEGGVIVSFSYVFQILSTSQPFFAIHWQKFNRKLIGNGFCPKDSTEIQVH